MSAMEETCAYTRPPVPENEEERLAELHSLALLDTTSEARFEDYTSLIAEIFDFPIVLLSLVDQDRQWFKSACGLNVRQTSRDVSFCAHAILHDSIFIVPDTHADPRFAENPLVVGEPFIRFYAGAVVRGPRGLPLGTLCLIDHKPRQLPEVDAGRLRQFAGLIQREISHSDDLASLRASVEFSAYYDPLTKLANRRLLLDRLQKLLESASARQSQVAVLLFNVAGQRLINQSFGSDAGDGLLMQIAERLEQSVPPGGTAARLQGDEFVVAFSVAGDTDLTLRLETTRALLAAPFQVRGRDYYLNIKCGVSLYPEGGSTSVQLLEQAAMAVRMPHNSGGSPDVRYFNTSDSISLTARLELESRLRLALENRAFSVVYQPIASLEDGRLASLEALIRWEDELLGEVPPQTFIPVAEASGLIIAMGEWILGEVCQQLERWNRQGPWEIPVAINVSVTELMQPGFTGRLLQCLARNRIPHDCLSLEITESSIASESPIVRENVAALVKADIRLAVDDFGTGYSALAYLQDLPLSYLKIDRSFVAGLPESHKDAVLSQAILNMAHGLQLNTVGEGVESQAQLDFLRRAGCHYAQGYFVSHPVPAHSVPALQGKCLL